MVNDVLRCSSAFSSPPEVRDEVEKALRKGVPEHSVFKVKSLETPAKREAEIISLKYSLGLGESTVLALSKQLKIRVFLTDDLDARLTAGQFRLRPVGSVGMVLRAYRRGKVSFEQARQLLSGLERDSSLFITPTLIQKALTALEAFHQKMRKGKH